MAIASRTARSFHRSIISLQHRRLHSARHVIANEQLSPYYLGTSFIMEIQYQTLCVPAGWAIVAMRLFEFPWFEYRSNMLFFDGNVTFGKVKLANSIKNISQSLV